MYRTRLRLAARTTFLAALLFAASAPSTFADPGGIGGVPIVVTMTGAAERPGPGDPDGSGTASFRFNPGREEVCYTLTVADIAPATAAHIHIAPTTVAGPVVIPLAAPTGGTSSGCTSADRELILEIVRNPENYYVNVHNADFPAGAVRGQLG